MSEENSLSKSSILLSLFNRNRRGFLWASALSFLLNGVIWNAMRGARQARITSGDFEKASSINALLEVTFQFNAIFAIIAGSIAAMLFMNLLSARYSSRLNAVRILRLCGLSLKSLVLVHVAEAFLFGVAASIIAMLFFGPAVWAYGQIMQVSGLVPQEVNISTDWTSALLVFGSAILFIIAASFLKTISMHQRKDRSSQTQRKHKLWKHKTFYLAGLFSMIVLGIVLVSPNSPIPEDARMVLIVPWACTLILVYGTKIAQQIGDFVQLPLRKVGRFPRLGLALSRLTTSLSTRMNPIIPLTVVLSFMIPLSAVMATGRSVSMIDVYDSVNAQSVAMTREIEDSDKLSAIVENSPGTIFVSTSSDLYREDDPYGPEQPVVGLIDLRQTKLFFPTLKEREGSIETVGGASIATSDDRFHVGDKMAFTTTDGRECLLTVSAVLDAPALLDFDVIGTPYDSPCGGLELNRTTAYSQLGTDELQKQLGDTQWDIEKKSDWISNGVSSTEHSQRSALIIMFLVPVAIAFLVTGVSVSSYRKMILRSSLTLFYTGGTKRDFRVTSCYEAVIGCIVALLFLIFSVGLNALILLPLAQSSGVGLRFDNLVVWAFLSLSLSAIVFVYLASGGWAYRKAKEWRNGKTR
ncbi:FtsX-like permease family protein [Arcanobacterium canis]